MSRGDNHSTHYAFVLLQNTVAAAVSSLFDVNDEVAHLEFGIKTPVAWNVGNMGECMYWAMRRERALRKRRRRREWL